MARCSSRELTEWQLLYQIKHEEQERAKHGEVIVHDGAAGRDDEDEDDADPEE